MTKRLQPKSSYIYIIVLCFFTTGNLSPCIVLAETMQSHKVTLIAVDVPLKDVFETITKQTGLAISNNFRETNLNENKKVVVNFWQTEINDVMTFLLSDKRDLGYILNKNIIIIHKNEGNAIGRVSNENDKDTSIRQHPVVGRVTDVTGNSIPGATIRVKDTKYGTITNADGKFQLPNAKVGSVIIISSVGFESSEIEVNNNNNITAPLKPYTNKLDENVVIAYGNTTKRFNTGNIGSLKASDIEKQPVNNPVLALEGRIPGVFIEQATGLPGTGITINIQGINSMSNGTDPFFVIDGIPYISQLVQPTIPGITAGAKNINGNPLNFINPATIESIEILKDADATAIYGSRAANGAVLITTKKGKNGVMKVALNIQNGWGKVGHKLKVLNAHQYLSMRHEALSTDNITSPSPYDYDLNGTWDTTQVKDWQKELIGGTSQYKDIQLSISGGNSLTQYLINGGLHKETTVYPGNFSDIRGSLHFNIRGSSVNQKFTIELSGAFMRDNNKLPSSDLTGPSVILSPVAPAPLNADETLNWQPSASGLTTFYLNPLIYTKLRNTHKTNNLISALKLSYELFPGFALRTNFGFNNITSNEVLPTPVTIAYPEARPFVQGSTSFTNTNMQSWLIEPMIEYNKHIYEGKLNIIIGGTLQGNDNNMQQITASGYSNDLLLQDLKSATTFVIGQSTINSYRYNAAYGRINYNWMDKYIINLTARRDGSSRFGPRNQFHNFGAVGAAWIFTQEPRIRDAVQFLSFGKLRASYGTTGNDQIGDYQFLDLYQTLSTSIAYQGGLGVMPTRLYTPNLEWETTKKLQAGLELGFAENRILFTANYNRNRSSNQLIAVPAPITTGFFSIFRNFNAIIQNTGWEFSINSTNIKNRNFNWSTSLNLTIPKNKLVTFSSTTNTVYKVGQPLTVFSAYEYAGVNDTTGTFQFKDEKGNIVASPSVPTKYINIDPTVYGGLQNSFSYKRFSLDVFLQYVHRTAQSLAFGYSFVTAGGFNLGQSNQPITVLDHWQKPGDKTFYSKYTTSFAASLPLSYAKASDAAFTDASFLRLKNVSLSWQMPDSWVKKIKIESLRVYMSAQNLLTITNYFGIDPESRGLALPPLRVVTFGIQASL